MTSFSLDLAKFGQKAIDNSEKVVRKIAFDMHSHIVQRMPRDTGRAVANQQISLNNLPSGSVMDFDKSGNATIRKGDAALAKFKLGDAIFLYNNVEYIIPLEFHQHSKQAPNGMFRISFEEIVQHLGAKAI